MTEPTVGATPEAPSHDRSIAIADHPDAITPGWLTNALRAAGTIDARAEVADAVCSPLGTGQMCDSVRIEITYGGDPAPDAPDTLVAKLPACDERSRATAVMLRNYDKEVRFYRELAGDLGVTTPKVHHADIDDTGASFVLLMDDLAPAEQGDQLAGCDADTAHAAIDELVGLHAPRWDDPTLIEIAWLYGDPDASRAMLAGLLPSLWAGFLDRYDDVLDAHVREAGTVLFDHLDGYLAPGGGPVTITHGDYRLDNLLIDPDTGAITVVDWQTVAVTNAMADVAYFIGAGLLPGDRRAHEDELVRRYHDALTAAGVDYRWDDCWDDYRAGTWAGLTMAVAASMLVGQTERGDAMFMTMASRHARHALDLGAEDTLR